jgi:glycosyltransferase involved in cell wall biosynthesis
MISGRDIIYISSIEWNFLWQGHQEIARRLADAGNRVLYLENTGVRSPGVRDAARVAFRLKRWADTLRSGGVREIAPNIYVCSPIVLPPFGSRLTREINRRVFLRLVRRTARKLGIRRPLVWTYLPNDTTLDLIRSLDRRGLVYYCVADFTQLTPNAARLRETEQALLEMCDVVFTNCSALANAFAPTNPNSHVFPFGVNLDAFPLDKNTADVNDHDDAAQVGVAVNSVSNSDRHAERFPKPVIGYVGGMHRHVDFELIRNMAAARPEWSWVCVGALQADTTGLAELPNVHLVGQKPHEELASYMRLFDVCIVPYVNSVYTETVVPTKINEYLAVGKPVVSTDLPTVCEFNEEHRVLFTAPARADSFLRAIESALAQPKDRATILHRRRVAELADWGTRLDAMSRLIEESLAAQTKAPDREAARAVASNA